MANNKMNLLLVFLSVMCLNWQTTNAANCPPEADVRPCSDVQECSKVTDCSGGKICCSNEFHQRCCVFPEGYSGESETKKLLIEVPY